MLGEKHLSSSDCRRDLFQLAIDLAIARTELLTGRRIWLTLGVCGDLSVLGYMKYANFTVENGNLLLHWLGYPTVTVPDVVLPLGVSFFTFHATSYLVDIYRRSAAAETHPLRYALYILPFPQLIAGPIVRWKQIYLQFRERSETVADFRWGATRFIVGLAKKMLIANPLGHVADQIFKLGADQLSPSVAWLGLVCYTSQIYFDFSGYSDMAIGLRMFGFRILENFDYPYISRSVREFWRRWHISLSTWFRDYVYIPIGGSQRSLTRTCSNIMIVFLLSGLWHGASWNFVLWGTWHGLFICIETAGLENILARAGPFAHVYGLAVVTFGWVFFRSSSFEHAVSYYGALFSHGYTGSGPIVGVYLSNEVTLALICGCIGSTPIIRYLANRLWTSESVVGSWVTAISVLRMAA